MKYYQILSWHAVSLIQTIKLWYPLWDYHSWLPNKLMIALLKLCKRSSHKSSILFSYFLKLILERKQYFSKNYSSTLVRNEMSHASLRAHSLLSMLFTILIVWVVVIKKTSEKWGSPSDVVATVSLLHSNSD